VSRAYSVKDLATGLGLVLLGAGTLWATADLATDAPAAADPSLLPRVVAVGLIGVGLAIAVAHIASRRRGLVTDEDAEGLPIDLPVDIPDELIREREEATTAGPTDWRQMLILGAAIVVYSFAAFRLGFVTSTVIFIAGIGLLLGRSRDVRSLVGLGVFSLAVSVGCYVAFFVLLDVRVPITPLP
jgi:hypothetical protein